MALNSMEGCSRYFEHCVVPQLRKEFPNLEYTRGSNFVWIRFERTPGWRRLTNYNAMRVWVNPRLQGNRCECTALVSGSVMSTDGPRFERFWWEDLDVMMDEIRRFGWRHTNLSKVRVLLMLVLLFLISFHISFTRINSPVVFP